MRRHFFVFSICVWAGALTTPAPAYAQPYGISQWNTSGATGMGCVSGPYVMSASAGEHSAGVPRTGGSYELTGGFWSGGGPVLLPTDQDTDFLPDAWEQTFGLAINCANVTDNASGDPDGDGKSNAEELANGTHPRGFFTRYLAEGAVNAFFRTDIAIANPDAANQALTLVRLQPEGGGAEKNTPIAVPAMAQRTVTRDTIATLHTGSFSAIVESDRLVVVDRTMAWDGSEYGASSESASVQPAATWYFAEGATGGPFDLFYLLQNPNETAVDLEIKYLRALGEPPLTKTYHLEPRSRRTIWVDEERFPDDGGSPLLSASDAAAVIQVTSGGPILAERAMYAFAPGESFSAGHASAGIRAPSSEWFLAEGATGSFFEMFILLANPNATEAAVSVSYLLTDGTIFNKSYTVPGNGRVTVWVDQEQIPEGSGVKPLADVALSTTLKSDQPIVVERAMWWPQEAGGWREGHSTAASTESATRWVTAGGEVGGTRNEQTYVLVANVDNVPALVRVTILPESGEPIVWEAPNPIAPKSRFNVPIDALLFPGVSGRFAVLVESLGPASAKIVVERALYWDANGVLWGAGAAALATSVP
jgi:hypothetical protein